MPEYLPDGSRKVWNPLARYYIEPLGEWIAERLQGTFVTPNMISIMNTILGSLSALFIIEGSWTSLIIFGIIVRFYHVWDVADGHLARTANLKSKYGGFIDGVGDRLVMGIWPAAMLITLMRGGDVFWWASWGLIFFMGLYMYMIVSMKADKHYGMINAKDNMIKDVKKNPLSRFFLFFIDGDIQYHFITICAFLNRLDIYIMFYAIYFNLNWIAYTGFYSLRWMRFKH